MEAPFWHPGGSGPAFEEHARAHMDPGLWRSGPKLRIRIVNSKESYAFIAPVRVEVAGPRRLASNCEFCLAQRASSGPISARESSASPVAGRSTRHCPDESPPAPRPHASSLDDAERAAGCSIVTGRHQSLSSRPAECPVAPEGIPHRHGRRVEVKIIRQFGSQAAGLSVRQLPGSIDRESSPHRQGRRSAAPSTPRSPRPKHVDLGAHAYQETSRPGARTPS